MGGAFFIFLKKNMEYFLKLLVCFLNEHKEKARAPRINTRHLNPSPWQCFPLFFSGQYSGRHDLRKARTRRLHARLAYVMRVANRASVAYAAVSARGTSQVKSS